MTMKVKNNTSATSTLNVLGRNQTELSKQLARLSSGMRINGAADDASSYAISERMRAQIRGVTQDLKNTQTARSLMNTAEGAVSSTVEILKTFKEKALDAANDTNTDRDRAIIQREIDQLIAQIDDNAHVTYNGKYLLNGSMGGNMPSDEHGVVVDFMSYLDNANLSAQEALDGAINYASGGLFSGESDLISSFLADMSSGDLLDITGINLSNADTGAITGLDAGGEKEKNAVSVVPEDGSPYTGGVPSGTTVINGLSVVWPDTGSDSAKQAIAKALNNQWLSLCTDLIQESYELNFTDPGTTVRSMTVNLSPTSIGANTLAQVVSTYDSTGKTIGLELQVNMDYYGNLDLSDENGAVAGDPNQLYLDRCIAHEMVHALMAANITHFADLPKYIKEGAAELVHGIDDYRKVTIEAMVADQARLKNALENSGSVSGDDAYAAGYMILRYMAHQAANAEPEKRMAFQIGTKANQAIKIGFGDMRSTALGLKKEDGTTLSVETQKKATAAITVIDRAISKALNQQTTIGAIQSRLDFTASNIITAHENVTASESTIRDADMALTFTEYTKANVLMQAAQAMLAQANQNSSSVLSLLQ
ncbi:flagellin N-terminal helical domain-containing protein [Schwartzia succinivorans]|jgi:flagellin|uniref:Flagellin n=1 Tax=Schwartzia succinivorans DSM 10502 TaxID=1123243 RepID=A0A1M5A539_9FIRM|nr:flagellin [Schwartzia succinivorans]SHF25371.1 flagellin [Schwartzia succinivorans DSM 10502]